MAGIGVLFIGMGMRSDAMVPLRDNAAFVHLMTKFSNPVDLESWRRVHGYYPVLLRLRGYFYRPLPWR